jgi:subtilisin family serine protease
MHIYDARGRRVELELVGEEVVPRATRELAAATVTSRVVRAGLAFFDLGRSRGLLRPTRAADGPPLASFREVDSGALRTVYRELVVRFGADVPARARRAILATHRLTARRTNAFVASQLVVNDRARRRTGPELIEAANALAELDEVVFATPNFVSEFRRGAVAIPPEQWHLQNLGTLPGQLAGEDVDALGAWAHTAGQRRVVAVLDDGVDIEHPNLRRRIWRNRDRTALDRVGRDFFLPDDHPDHYNPRPKRFRFPFDQLAGNDIHGTPCAGVVAANGRGAYGVAWGARVLAVKIFHADDLAADERVADAIRYAATRADVLSCSWTGPRSPDIELALADAGTLGRGGRGSPVFCATGNDSANEVGYPASDPNAVAVGASTDRGRLASYSNTGPEVSVVAPSSGGVAGIFTTDVSSPGRGFNLGDAAEGGVDGLHTNAFGGTSSATPLAGGIAALVLSANSRLDRQEVKAILQETADRIGSGYNAQGHSNRFGYGRVNAARAVTEALKQRSSPGRTGAARPA